ncbi:MAG: OmpA family protein [Bacteroidota bacterium]|nr:OmpA family protein [Bacteroidota bacterium]
MVSKSIAAKRLKTIGYGSSKPLASNETEEGRQQNRRVEFTILKE